MKNKAAIKQGAFGSYRGCVHGIRVTEPTANTSHSHVPMNIASSGFREYELPEGSVKDMKKRMWRNACRP